MRLEEWTVSDLKCGITNLRDYWSEWLARKERAADAQVVDRIERHIKKLRKQIYLLETELAGRGRSMPRS